MIAPSPTPDDAYFWQGVADDRLLLRKCAGCGQLQHPPSPMCPECGSVDWTTHRACGRGTVHSWIVSRHPNRADDEARVVAVVELAEGIRIVSNLTGVDTSGVVNDMAVGVEFTEIDGVKLPQFRPVPERSPG